MKYKVNASNPHHHLVEIEMYVSDHQGSVLEVQLPSWRPGRYELGNFAKNVKSWAALDNKGNALVFSKINKDLWRVNTPGISEVLIRYTYFANEMTAGNSCFNEQMLYLNPVNCFMYVPGREEEPCQVEISGMAANCEVACQMEREGKWVLKAPDFDYLADSPMVVSPYLKHFHFQLDASEIHLWFTGDFAGDFGEILEHTHAYCRKQVEIFGELPSKRYHFLYHILPYRFHHGVEHLDSTVIALGPGDQFGTLDFYREFLGVSSHEFYHLWNIKRIRPAEMQPYNLTKENYSRQGYVYEGVTTYMGDLMLLRSNVFEWEEYANTFNVLLQRHFDNYGRYNLSVAASSWDTWLDGYVPGVFGRKVSIYVEGALATFILDTILMRSSANKISVDEVMRRLYSDFYKEGKGYTQADYLQLISELSGKSQQQYVDEVLEGTGFIEQYLPKALDYVGCLLDKADSPVFMEREWGMKMARENGVWVVKMVAPGSPADMAGVGENELLVAVDGSAVGDMEDLSAWLNTQHRPEFNLEVKKLNKVHQLRIVLNKDSYWPRYAIMKQAGASDMQKAAFRKWTHTDF